jgi:hypothetical protein
MSLPKLAIEKQPVTYFAIALVVVAGIFSYFQLGQLEDPEFSVKTASIITTYPGASAKQVELEVTDRIETKLQEMPELKNVYSNSRPGLSIIKVDIKNEYWSDRLPQVWDGLRKKIRDMETTLPPGAGRPKVGDDFGYVFGFLLAVLTVNSGSSSCPNCVNASIPPKRMTAVVNPVTTFLSIETFAKLIPRPPMNALALLNALAIRKCSPAVPQVSSAISMRQWSLGSEECAHADLLRGNGHRR